MMRNLRCRITLTITNKLPHIDAIIISIIKKELKIFNAIYVQLKSIRFSVRLAMVVVVAAAAVVAVVKFVSVLLTFVPSVTAISYITYRLSNYPSSSPQRRRRIGHPITDVVVEFVFDK